MLEADPAGGGRIAGTAGGDRSVFLTDWRWSTDPAPAARGAIRPVFEATGFTVLLVEGGRDKNREKAGAAQGVIGRIDPSAS